MAAGVLRRATGGGGEPCSEQHLERHCSQRELLTPDETRALPSLLSLLSRSSSSSSSTAHEESRVETHVSAAALLPTPPPPLLLLLLLPLHSHARCLRSRDHKSPFGVMSAAAEDAGTVSGQGRQEARTAISQSEVSNEMRGAERMRKDRTAGERRRALTVLLIKYISLCLPACVCV